MLPVCTMGWAAPLHLSVCISLSAADSCAEVVCTAGCGGACLLDWFSVCSGLFLVCAECARGFDW